MFKTFLSDTEQYELFKCQREQKGLEKITDRDRELVKKPIGQSCTGCQALFSNSVHARGGEKKKEAKLVAAEHCTHVVALLQAHPAQSSIVPYLSLWAFESLNLLPDWKAW